MEALLFPRRAFEDKRSHYEPSVAGAADEQDHATLDDHDFYVPHFQRVSISGEDTSGVSVLDLSATISPLPGKPHEGVLTRFPQVPLEDLERASKLIVQALQIRQRYMQMSHQSFSSTASRFLNPDSKLNDHHDDKQTIEGGSGDN